MPLIPATAEYTDASDGQTTPRTARVHLSLGANLGDRKGHLEAAIAALDALSGVRVVMVSSIYETEPVGPVEQPAFFNAAAEIETALGPLALLNAVKALEKQLGRTPSEPWGPRVIDIDLVMWEDNVAETGTLTLPHPAYRDRAFVLVPMAEIAPGLADPRTGETMAELAAKPGLAGHVLRIV